MIRPARAADAPALAALLNHWILHTAVTFNPVPRTEGDIPDMIAAKAAAGHAFLVAEEAGVLIGQASYGQFRGGEGYRSCMEHSISLLPGTPRKGLGRSLLTAIEDHARAGGAHQMIAGISGENADGQAFHARMGYRPLAIIPEAGHKFGRYMDLVLMQKFLRQAIRIGPYGTSSWWGSPMMYGGLGMYPTMGLLNPFYWDPWYGARRMNNGQIFNGFVYTDAIVAGFTAKGDLIWDNSLPFENVRSMELKEKMRIKPNDDKTVSMFYSSRGAIKAKVFDRDKVLEDLRPIPIMTADLGDKVRQTSTDEVVYWYDNFYLAFGYQRITGDDGRRNFRAVGADPEPYAVDFRSYTPSAFPATYLPRAEYLARSTEMLRELFGRAVYRAQGYAVYR